MYIKKNILTHNDCYLAGKTITPRGIVVHSTGCNQKKVAVFLKNWNKSGVSVCVHGFIGVLVERNVFRNSKVREKAEVLINYPYAAFHGNLGRNAFHSFSAKNDFASFVGFYNTRNYFDHRGFAASVFSDKAVDFAHIEVKINVFKGMNAAIVLVDVVQLDEFFCHLNHRFSLKNERWQIDALNLPSLATNQNLFIRNRDHLRFRQ